MKTRISKEDKRYWHDRTMRLFNEFPEMQLTENRIMAHKMLIQKRYQQIIDGVSPDTILQFIKVIIHNDRKMRLYTQGLQDKIKKQLSDQYLVEQDQFI